MAVRQLSIFLENRRGRLQAVADILASNQINIRALSIADTAEFGIVRLIVDNLEKAETILKENGFVFHVNDVTAIEVEGKPGGLAKVLAILNKVNVNVEYMYTMAESQRANSVLLLRFSEPTLARATLREGGIALLNDGDLGLN